jgi:hypothetical protein
VTRPSRSPLLAFGAVALALLGLGALALALIAACSGGGGGNGNGPTSIPNGGSFVEARDALANRLAAMGPSIAELPQDVRDDLLSDCEALARYADEDEVEEICAALSRAIDRGDTGTVDIVVNQLRQLEEG